MYVELLKMLSNNSYYLERRNLMEQEEDFLSKANQIMTDALDKAGELLSRKPEIAEVILKQILKCDPEHLGALQLLGLTKHRMGENAESIEIIQTALELDPLNPDNWNNLGLAYGGLENHKKAIECFQKAIEIKPSQYLYKNNMALQYRALEDYDNAIATMKEAIASNEQPQIWLNLGGIYLELKNIDEAKKCFERALRLDPELSAAYVDLAFAHHLAGNWKEGFAFYEWRVWYYHQMRFYRNAYDMNKLWNGKDDLNGKTVLIYGEQGLGDIIQFSRYIKGLKALGAYVILHCPANLDSVLKRVEGVDETTNQDITVDDPVPFKDYDYQMPIMSLPHLLKIKEITGEPFIKSLTSAFKEYIENEYKDVFKIGIVWAGSPSHPHDRKRSIPLKHFKPIYDTEGVKLFNLQMDIRKRQYGVSYRCMENPDGKANDKFKAENGIVDYCDGCDDLRLIDLTQMIQSFEDTAVILEGLDLIICCDTSIAHLAGAMGKPVWVCLPYNPDWRWLAEGETTHWYDSMKLYRQPERDDWTSVFSKIKKDLDALLQNK